MLRKTDGIFQILSNNSFLLTHRVVLSKYDGKVICLSLVIALQRRVAELSKICAFPHTALTFSGWLKQNKVFDFPHFLLMKDDRSNSGAHKWKSLFCVIRISLFPL